MPFALTGLTPNLVVSDVTRSLAFYRDVLGFTSEGTVPDKPPYAFAMLRSGEVRVFLNSVESATAEYPAFNQRPLGGTLTLFIDVVGVRETYESLKGLVKVVMPLERKWYGVTEFAFEDPDGYVITFAEHEQ